MRSTISFVSRWVTNAFFTLFAIASSVKPEDAMSNLSGWAALLHLPTPAWVQSHTADRVVFWIALSGLAFWLAPMVLRKLKHRSAQGASSRNRVNIVLGTGNPFEVLQPSGINVSRIVSVRIDNNTDLEISDGELRVLHLDPPHRGQGEWLLENGIAIGPHKQTFVKVATYAQGNSQAKPGTWMKLIIPLGGFVFAEALPLLPLKPHTFQLKFLSPERGFFDQIACRLYVDTERVLHLENQISPQSSAALSNRISLYEAATRAYEALQHHDSVIPMEAFTESPNEILTNICEMLCRAQRVSEPLVKLYGNKAPSRIQEEIYMAPLNKYDFVVEGNLIVLVGHHGSARYENLMVELDQVEAAIAEIKRRHEP